MVRMAVAPTRWISIAVMAMVFSDDATGHQLGNPLVGQPEASENGLIVFAQRRGRTAIANRCFRQTDRVCDARCVIARVVRQGLPHFAMRDLWVIEYLLHVVDGTAGDIV